MLQTAIDDTAIVNEDASTTITVSTNDDIGGDGGDGEDYSLTSGPSNGTVTETSDGVFVYSPNADFNGSRQFHIYDHRCRRRHRYSNC